MKQKTRILIAPLNWGLGHATRCIPIINALLNHNFQPIIASDGDALKLLKKEFPDLIHLKLPSYNIKYARNGRFLKLALLSQIPRIVKSVRNEKKNIQNLVSKYNIKGIISDNRFGVFNKTLPSVYITHQLNVLSGNTTWLSSILHQQIIKKFDQCWVPDYENEPNLSGRLGHSNNSQVEIKYLGPLSRFLPNETTKKNKLMVLLSGPEPQRSVLEKLLLLELKSYNNTIIFVQGIVELEQKITTKGNFTIINFMLSHELEKTIQESEIIIARSGYSTIMDLAKISKKVFFIPTPGQFEQEYLAKRLSSNRIAPYCKQDDFSVKQLDALENYSGFRNLNFMPFTKDLFSLFESE